MTTDNPVRMDIPAVRAARIELRVAELRVLAARTALEYWRSHPLLPLRSKPDPVAVAAARSQLRRLFAARGVRF